jgi:hypothetical protein
MHNVNPLGAPPWQESFMRLQAISSLPSSAPR